MREAAGMRRHDGWETVLIGGILAVAVLAAHAGALRGGFHYDDWDSIVENPAVRVWQPLYYLTSPLASSNGVEGAGYRPLTVATFAANHVIGRYDPRGYLAVNLGLHLAVSWMVFVLGRRFLGDARWAAVAAIIYGIHPVNAEAVNYIVARSSLLAALGTLAAVWAYLRRRDGGGMVWTLFGLSAFAAALLSKESAVGFVIAMAAYEWVYPSAGSRVRRVAPYGAVLLVYLVVWWFVAGGRISPPGGVVHPAWTFLELAERSLLLWIWPWPLGLDHPLTFITRFDPILATGLGVGVVVWGWAIVRLRGRVPFVAWALAWIAAAIVPLAPLPWMTTQALLQENRLACAAVALAWLTAAGLRVAVVRLPRAVAMAGGVALLLGAVALDRARSEVWHDDRRLWEEVVARSPSSQVARINLGAAYVKRGETDRAEAEFHRALMLVADDPRAYYHLGLLALRRERYDEARAWFLKTLALAPQSWEAYHGLGEAEMAGGRFDEAVAALRQAVALNPRDAKAHARLGLLAQQAGDDAGAEGAYLTALRDDPDNPEVLNNLGAVYLARREWARALEPLTAAVRRDPEYVEAAYNRALALDALGRAAEARTVLITVLERLPPEPRFEARRRAVLALLREATIQRHARDEGGL